ncbi:MAG: UbiA family prenyltransferase [Planctomycetota bacterium]
MYLFKFLQISRPSILAIAFMGTFTFGWLFTGKHLWLLASICAFDWFIVNLLNRVADLREDEANHIFGTSFAAQYQNFILRGGLTSLILSFPLFYFFFPEIFWLRVGYHLLGLSYNWSFLPGGRRIKQLYFWKNTASAIGFIVTVFLYPLATIQNWSQMPSDITLETILFSGVFFFFFEISYEIIYDLRDIAGDTQNNIQTYPVVHGQTGAVKIIDTLLLLSILTLGVGYGTHWVPWRIFIMFVAPIFQFFYYKHALKRGLNSRDCILLTWLGASLLVIYNFWVYFRLPGA